MNITIEVDCQQPMAAMWLKDCLEPEFQAVYTGPSQIEVSGEATKLLSTLASMNITKQDIHIKETYNAN